MKLDDGLALVSYALKLRLGSLKGLLMTLIFVGNFTGFIDPGSITSICACFLSSVRTAWIVLLMASSAGFSASRVSFLDPLPSVCSSFSSNFLSLDSSYSRSESTFS